MNECCCAYAKNCTAHGIELRSYEQVDMFINAVNDADARKWRHSLRLAGLLA